VPNLYLIRAQYLWRLALESSIERNMASFRPTRHHVLLVLVSALVAVSLVQNYVLVRQNGTLRRALATANAALSDEAQHIPARLVRLVGIGLDRKRHSVSLADGTIGHVILAISPSCPACTSSLAGWVSALNEVDSKRWRVVWVSSGPIDDVETFTKFAPPTHEILADVTFYTYSALGLRIVPKTLLVAADGTVRQAWVGQQTPKDLQEFRRLLLR
jgi:peroxiredoxin